MKKLDRYYSEAAVHRFLLFIKRQTSDKSSDNEWQRVVDTTSDNEWYNERQRKTTNDNEWQRMTTSDNEWQRVTTNDNEWSFLLIFLFLE